MRVRQRRRWLLHRVPALHEVLAGCAEPPLGHRFPCRAFGLCSHSSLGEIPATPDRKGAALAVENAQAHAAVAVDAEELSTDALHCGSFPKESTTSALHRRHRVPHAPQLHPVAGPDRSSGGLPTPSHRLPLPARAQPPPVVAPHQCEAAASLSASSRSCEQTSMDCGDSSPARSPSPRIVAPSGVARGESPLMVVSSFEDLGVLTCSV